MHNQWAKNTWNGNLGASCLITNNETVLYDVTNINELVQRSLSNMPAMKKSKLHMKVHQVYSSKKLHVLWFMKYCIMAGANLYSLTCKLLQESKIADFKNNLVILSTGSNIMLECQIKTHDGWVAAVKFLQETGPENVQVAKSSTKKILMSYMLNLAIHLM